MSAFLVALGSALMVGAFVGLVVYVVAVVLT